MEWCVHFGFVNRRLYSTRLAGANKCFGAGDQCRFSSFRHIYASYDGRLTFGLPLLPSYCQGYESICPRFHVVAQTWRQPEPRWKTKLHTEEPQREGEIRRFSNIMFFFASKFTLRAIEREGRAAKRREARGYSAPNFSYSVPVQCLCPWVMEFVQTRLRTSMFRF